MIWSLVREQLKSQRRFNLWTGLVIAVTAGVSELGALARALVLMGVQSDIDHVAGVDRQNTADLEVATTPGAMGENGSPLPTQQQVTHALDVANADGASAVAVAEISADLVVDGDALRSAMGVVALDGAVDWDAIVVEGNPPSAGQVVVDAQYTAANDLPHRRFGPAGEYWLDGFHGRVDDLIDATLVISGLSHSGVNRLPVHLTVPGGYVAWAERRAALENASFEERSASGQADTPGQPFRLGQPRVERRGAEHLRAPWPRGHRLRNSPSPVTSRPPIGSSQSRSLLPLPSAHSSSAPSPWPSPWAGPRPSRVASGSLRHESFGVKPRRIVRRRSLKR